MCSETRQSSLQQRVNLQASRKSCMALRLSFQYSCSGGHHVRQVSGSNCRYFSLFVEIVFPSLCLNSLFILPLKFSGLL